MASAGGVPPLPSPQRHHTPAGGLAAAVPHREGRSAALPSPKTPWTAPLNERFDEKSVSGLRSRHGEAFHLSVHSVQRTVYTGVDTLNVSYHVVVHSLLHSFRSS